MPSGFEFFVGLVWVVEGECWWEEVRGVWWVG